MSDQGAPSREGDDDIDLDASEEYSEQNHEEQPAGTRPDRAVDPDSEEETPDSGT